MPSGLIQLVSLGVTDIFLTGDPQITFFKIVYRKYTNFSMQTFELNFDESADFNKNLTCKIPSNGDLIYKAYLKIILPQVNPSIFQYLLKDSNYDIYKKGKIYKLNQKYNTEKVVFDNLENYSTYIIEATNIVKKTMMAQNVSLENIKRKIINYNTKYSLEIKNAIELISSEINKETNVISFIVNYETYSDVGFYDDINSQIEKKYNKLISYITYQFNLVNNVSDQIQKITDSDIYFAWIKYLGNFIYENMDLYIGGHKIEYLTNDWNHIMSKASITEHQIEIYNSMIGNVRQLTEFDNDKKDSYTLLIPLEFSFCKNPGTALPLVALRYQEININIKMNKIQNCCYIENYELLYNQIISVDYQRSELNLNNNTITDKDGLILNFSQLEFNKDLNTFKYKIKNINYILLVNKYEINNDDANYVLNTFGEEDLENNELRLLDVNKNVISLKGFYKLLYSDDQKAIEIFKTFLPLLDKDNKDMILNSIHLQDASLLVDYIFLDNTERQKFAQSQHEYLIQQLTINQEPLNNSTNISMDLGIFHPVKDLVWFIRPNDYISSDLSVYYESKYWNYSNSYFIAENKNFNPIISSQLELNNMNIFPSNQDNLFYNSLQAYEYYNNSFPIGINVYCFSLFPLEYQPSGSCNFTTFKSKILRIKIDKNYYDMNTDLFKQNDIQFFVFSCSYNILRIMGGMAAVGFS